MIELMELCLVEECGNWAPVVFTIPEYVLGYFEMFGHIVEAGDPLHFCEEHARQVRSGELELF